MEARICSRQLPKTVSVNYHVQQVINLQTFSPCLSELSNYFLYRKSLWISVAMGQNPVASFGYFKNNPQVLICRMEKVVYQ